MSEIHKAVVFAIMMQTRRGIIDKAPTYMLEKWDAVKDMRHPENLLDSPNMQIYITWQNKWLSKPPDSP